ncbi:MAG: CoA transferase [Acidimicrobiales bacterium]
MGALTDVRVLDFGRYIAGPFCAALLGDLGADVIRVERVDGGEDRFVGPVTDDGVGSMFLQCNRNKRCLTLNPVKEEGREVVRRLVATADVVVANLPPATLVQMGLDYDTLRAIKADIILTTVNAFGSGGPWSNKVGFDGLAQSASGNLHLSGPADQPVRSFVPYVDFGTASLSALATVAALRHRDQTGEGQFIEGALLRTALTFNAGALIEQDLLGIDRVGTMNRGQTSGPADVHRTKDGWVMVLVIGVPVRTVVRAAGRPELLSDDRFKDDLACGDNGEALSAIMDEWCGQRTTDEVLALLEQHKVPGGPVYSPQQALDDEHINAIDFLKDTEYPTAAKPVRLADFPVRLSASPGEIRHRAPQLGEHTEEILASLGYSNDDIASLRDARIV